MEYTITEKQLNTILDYLGRKPYGEVYQLIDMIRQLAKPIEKADKTPKA